VFCVGNCLGIKNLPPGIVSELLGEVIGLKSGGKVKIIRKASSQDVFGGSKRVKSGNGIECD
jgi:hypothetical protein